MSESAFVAHSARPHIPELDLTKFLLFSGESGVGKSSLIGFLTAGAFPTNVKSTVGLDYSVRTLRIGDETVVFQLWDTAGQERYVYQLPCDAVM